MDFHIDLGQVILSIGMILLGTIGYLIKQDLNDFKNQIKAYEIRLYDLTKDVQKLIGIYEGISLNRRATDKTDALWPGDSQ